MNQSRSFLLFSVLKVQVSRINRENEFSFQIPCSIMMSGTWFLYILYQIGALKITLVTKHVITLMRMLEVTLVGLFGRSRTHARVIERSLNLRTKLLENGLKSHWKSLNWVPDKGQEPLLEHICCVSCATFVRTTFWRHVRPLVEQTHSNLDSFCEPHNVSMIS